MKKNVASQAIGAQMITVADGSNFTGAVTVYITGDNGTQTVGSVGSGACTHEGRGYHSYAPSQAETNYDHIAFTFEGTGAITTTVQVFTSFPQTGDNFARIGAPVGASISADIAAVKTQTAAIETDTQDIQGRLPAALVSGRIDASVGAMAANVMTAAAAAADLTTELQSGLATAANLATVDTVVDAIKAVTDLLPDAGALTSLATAANLATVDTVVDAIKATTDKVDDTLEDDAGTYRFTTNALEQAPAGGGGGGDATEAKQDTIIAALAVVDGIVDAILVDTAEIGAAGAGLTAVPWNAAWDAEVQSEAADALAAYDPPTHAELVSEINSVQTDVAGLSIPTTAQIADKILTRHIAGGSDVSGSEARNVTNALRALRNRQAIAAGTGTVYEEDDTTAAWTYAATTTAGNPLSEINPT